MEKKDITWAGTGILFYILSGLLSRDPCGRLQFLVCFCFPILFSFLETENQKQVKDASNSISVTTREDRRRRRRRCRELCSRCTHTQTEKNEKKEENLYKKSCGRVGMSECSARNERPPARAAHRRRRRIRKSNVFATSVLSSRGNSMP